MLEGPTVPEVAEPVAIAPGATVTEPEPDVAKSPLTVGTKSAVKVVAALAAGTSQNALDVEGEVAERKDWPCEQRSVTPPCSKDTVPLGTRLEPLDVFATTASRRTSPGEFWSGPPESEVVVVARPIVTATRCAALTVLAAREL